MVYLILVYGEYWNFSVSCTECRDKNRRQRFTVFQGSEWCDLCSAATLNASLHDFGQVVRSLDPIFPKSLCSRVILTGKISVFAMSRISRLALEVIATKKDTCHSNRDSFLANTRLETP